MAGTQVAGIRNLVGNYNEAYAGQTLGVITSYTTDYVWMRWRIGTAPNTLDVPFDGAIPPQIRA